MASLISALPLVVGGLVVIQILVVVYNRFQRSSKAKRLGCKPPPAWPRPTWDFLGFGLLLYLAAAAKRVELVQGFMDLFRTISEEEHRDVDTIAFTIAGTYKFCTKDPKNIQAILATQFDDFQIGRLRINNFMPLLGPGIFNSNGPQWAHQRAMLRPSFARDQINEPHTQEKHVEVLMSRLEPNEKGWTPEVDLSPMFFNMTLDQATEFLFGESTNTQSAEMAGTRSAGKIFGEQFDLAQESLSDRFRLSKFYWVHNPKSFRDACKDCHAFIDNYVQLALSKPASTASTEKDLERGKKFVFLDELVKNTRDPFEIRANLFNILLAGRDTTASLLGYLFALLARNPVVYARLREAIIADFGEADSPRKEINFASLKNCTYLQYSLNESLRLHPAVPYNGPRTATKDTTLPRGGGPDGLSPVFVHKGQEVDYIVYGSQRDPKFWGNDAAAFKPERWEGRKSSWEYLPFNGGPRVCIGQQFALTSAGFATVKLLQRFDQIENMDPVAHIVDLLKVTSQTGNGTKVRLHAVGH